jgi:hypothetical protein
MITQRALRVEWLPCFREELIGRPWSHSGFRIWDFWIAKSLRGDSWVFPDSGDDCNAMRKCFARRLSRLSS